jgi:hypothetical protein
MPSPRHRLYKPFLLALALLLLGGVGQLQKILNQLRADPDLKLTRVTPLENAPPVLAFTTVALGGFRGLIANVLWIRANDLQLDGKYFEMVQLADWITKLEPHFTQVWLVQSWNMAYNISVKFSDPQDRWRWVQRGIELLRDDGLRYNPKDALIYRELAWFFQHKMGQNMDDAHLYYKTQWAKEMTDVLGGGHPDFQALLHPQTAEAKARVRLLQDRYKMDPATIQKVDRDYGPLDWRLPETSAIYWAVVGLEKSTKKDLITLRRVIYQSMQMATLRGRLFIVHTSEGDSIRLSPNLDIASQANKAFERMIAEDEEMRDSIKSAHRYFLMDVAYLMYAYNRNAEGQKWFRLLREKYPDSVPPGVTLEEYSLRRLTANIGSLTHDQTQGVIEGLIVQSFFSQAIGEDDRAVGLRQMALRIWNDYQSKIQGQEGRIGLPSFLEIVATVRDRLLAPGGMDPVLAAQLRTALGLPPPAAKPAPSTNAPPANPDNRKG